MIGPKCSVNHLTLDSIYFESLAMGILYHNQYLSGWMVVRNFYTYTYCTDSSLLEILILVCHPLTWGRLSRFICLMAEQN